MKLSKDQQRILEELTRQRAQFDQRKAEFDLEYRTAIDSLKNPIRETLIEADEAGIPIRRRHMALGFEQVGPYVRFLETEKVSLADRVRAAERGHTATAGTRFSVSVEQENTGPITLAVIDDSQGLWEARRGGSKIVAFHINDPIPWEPGTTHIIYPREFADIAERDEIFALVKEQYPDLEWDEF